MPMKVPEHVEGVEGAGGILNCSAKLCVILRENLRDPFIYLAALR